jgi:hypothetical protein
MVFAQHGSFFIYKISLWNALFLFVNAKMEEISSIKVKVLKWAVKKIAVDFTNVADKIIWALHI